MEFLLSFSFGFDKKRLEACALCCRNGTILLVFSGFLFYNRNSCAMIL